MTTYGIRDGYQHREKPNYFHDVQSDGKLWQPDVLAIAAHLGRKAWLIGLTDIGCGRGEKLVPYADEFDLRGIDYGENIEYAKLHYPKQAEWVNCDLETTHLRFKQNHEIVVCADVIEHLVSPENLIKSLDEAVFSQAPIVLTTPDRQRVYGYDHPGVPSNPHHVREWTLAELRTFLSAYLPAPAWAGWTLNNNVDRALNTCLLIFGSVDVSDLDKLFTLERAA